MDTIAFVFSLAGISLGMLGFLFGSTAYSKVQALRNEIESLRETIRAMQED